jgi:hypothetical protein
MKHETIEELKEVFENNIAMLATDFKSNTGQEIKTINVEYMDDGQGNRIITSVDMILNEGR